MTYFEVIDVQDVGVVICCRSWHGLTFWL